MERVTEKAEICKYTRAITAKTLYTSLSELLDSGKPISEINLQEEWSRNLSQEKNIIADGWYSPPPHGIGILFGTKDNSRLNFDSLRKEENHPQKDIFLDKNEGLIYAYASPVDKDTGVIGDFGIVLYFGKDEEVQKLLKSSLEINREIQKEIKKEIKLGLKLSDIYNSAQTIINRANLCNKNIGSLSPSKNIGHTIPNLNLNQEWDGLVSQISKDRFFINAGEVLTIDSNTALTIEPRLTSKLNPNLPLVSYHTTYLKEQLLENFDDLFRLADMNYML